MKDLKPEEVVAAVDEVTHASRPRAVLKGFVMTWDRALRDREAMKGRGLRGAEDFARRA